MIPFEYRTPGSLEEALKDLNDVGSEGKLIAGGRMYARPFVEPASSDPYRIVFLGASTVQGYPHPRSLAAAAFPEAMLEDVWPEKEVQVFNLEITSLASFAVARVLEMP